MKSTHLLYSHYHRQQNHIEIQRYFGSNVCISNHTGFYIQARVLSLTKTILIPPLTPTHFTSRAYNSTCQQKLGYSLPALQALPPLSQPSQANEEKASWETPKQQRDPNLLLRSTLRLTHLNTTLYKSTHSLRPPHPWPSLMTGRV